MNSLPPFLLLDLDDTILNFDGASQACWKQVCETFAPQIKGVTATALLSAVETARAWYWSDSDRHRAGRFDFQSARRAVVRHAFEQLGQSDPKLAETIADAYTASQEDLILPFPGAIPFLERCQAQGIRMALVTNGNAPAQRRKIERFGLGALFQTILIEGEFGIGKPDHRIFQQALACLQAMPNQACMIGNDLAFDIQPALQLGMEAVWVDTAGKGLPEDSLVRPSRTVRSLAEWFT